MDVQAQTETTITVRLTENEARELYRDLQNAESLPNDNLVASRLCVLLLELFGEPPMSYYPPGVR